MIFGQTYVDTFDFPAEELKQNGFREAHSRADSREPVVSGPKPAHQILSVPVRKRRCLPDAPARCGDKRRSVRREAGRRSLRPGRSVHAPRPGIPVGERKMVRYSGRLRQQRDSAAFGDQIIVGRRDGLHIARAGAFLPGRSCPCSPSGMAKADGTRVSRTFTWSRSRLPCSRF